MGKERPILMSAPMVRASLDGRKWQTRRVVKPQPACNVAGMYADRYNEGDEWAYWLPDNRMDAPRTFRCPYGVPGDRLWVRETWGFDSTVRADFRPLLGRHDLSGRDMLTAVRYLASSAANEARRWRPSIHMPRWASRITLELTDVRVQRLQDITEEDARAEGVDWAAPRPYGERWDDDDREDPREVGYPPAGASFALDNFRRLWDSINGARPGCSWADNPWVWCLSFRRVEGGNG